MGIFHEYIPSQKAAIMTFIEQQKTLAQVADALNKEDPKCAERKPSLQSIFEVTRKKSLSDVITKFQSETEDFLKESEKIEEKIISVHNSIEHIDDIKPNEKCLLKNSQSTLAIKRVQQLEGGDSKYNSIKSSKKKTPNQQKSKFITATCSTSTSRKKSSTVKFDTNPKSSIMSLPSTVKRKSSIINVKVNPSVRKILDEAKEKHEIMKKNPKKLNVEVVNLVLK